jgi:hypothetical protein
MLNSRMKDFFDLWLLSQHFDFDGEILAKAIQRTFANRGREIPGSPTAFTAEFAGDPAKQAQWRAFVRQRHLDFAPAEFQKVVGEIARFLGPVVKALAGQRIFHRGWKAPGPWA